MVLDRKKLEKGRKVIYQGNGFTEEGVITSWNETYIFVRYGSDVNSKATNETNLEFLRNE